VGLPSVKKKRSYKANQGLKEEKLWKSELIRKRGLYYKRGRESDNYTLRGSHYFNKKKEVERTTFSPQKGRR